MQAVVRAAVEQALAPILQKQRELEQALAPVLQKRVDLDGALARLKDKQAELEQALAPVLQRQDELEQAFTPILQRQDEVEQALAPILQKQDEVEQRVEAVASELRSEYARVVASRLPEAGSPPHPETTPNRAASPPPLPSTTRGNVRPASAAFKAAAPAAVRQPASNPFLKKAASTADPGSGLLSLTVDLAMGDAPPPSQPLPTNSPSPTYGTTPVAATETTLVSASAGRTQAVFARDLADMPWELNGARRRRTIAWAVGIMTFVAVAVLCTAMVLSQLGYKV